MKNVKVWRILFIFIFLSLLSVAIPAGPAQAERGITLSPTEGVIGASITITGTEFNKSTGKTDKYAVIYFSSDEASMLNDIDVDVIHYKVVKEAVWLDEYGDFETTFRVPEILDDGSREEEVTSGTYYVYVCHYLGTTIQPRIRAMATFTVTMGKISLSPLRGTVDTQVEITGIDFASNTELTIKYDESTIPVYSGNEQTSSRGGFTSMIRIPDSTAGAHTVSASVSDDEAKATFTVEPEILINPTSGEPGSTVIVSGTGFGKQMSVTIWLHDAVVETTTTNTLGSFYTNFNVPELQAGLYNVDAEQGANLAKAIFTLTVPPAPPPPPTPPPPEPSPAINLSETSGSIGQGLVMSGSGFRADTTVIIKYDNELLTAVTTDSNGVFAAALTIPPSKYGNHNLTASDGVNTSELNFAVESAPPPVPALLQPGAEIKVKPPVFFDWLDVDDPSPPVTYDIQVAISNDFSATSVVLDKKGLTKTEYSLSEEEMQRLGIGKNRYYWRIRAVDGASNEGDWANPRAFYIVTSAIPVWAMVVIAIIVVLFLLALGYFIRIRTSSLK